MNTRINYLYRDADNYKVINSVVICGEMTKEQETHILDSLNERVYFIPSRVGMPGEKFDSETEADHPWFEWVGTEVTNDDATLNISAEELMSRFGEMANSWEEGNLDELCRLVNQTRAELHQMIDSRIDAFLQGISTGEFQRKPEWKHPLTWSSAAFKGTKAAAVILPDGSEVETHTWREVAEAILTDCNADPNRHARLVALCDRVNGNFRPLLSSRPEKMVMPIMVDEGIYFESKLDTEQLLRVLREKVLKPAGYDCAAVTIRHMERTQTRVQEQEQKRDMEMPL